MNKDKVVIEALNKEHSKSNFSSGIIELDNYLHHHAKQDIKRRLAVTYIMRFESGKYIIGYYSLAATSILLHELPHQLTQKLPRYPLLPAILLARLAVDKQYQKQGKGELLLIDALKRSYSLSSAIGSIAIIVEAKNSQAVNFYQHYGFISFTNHKQKLFLPIETLKNIV